MSCLRRPKPLWKSSCSLCCSGDIRTTSAKSWSDRRGCALQAAFRKWRQVTPTEYLRTIRLQRVRDALLQADPSTTVTDVALDHGFFHLGRFSQHYKRAFGENPAATLARTRRCFRPTSLNSYDDA